MNLIRYFRRKGCPLRETKVCVAIATAVYIGEYLLRQKS